MSWRVIELREPRAALERARSFLVARPLEHNLLLTILDQGIEFSLDGTFWLVDDGSDVVGFALQSPPGMRVVLASMATAACHAVADATAAALPGVVGEASAAAAFAGRWTDSNETSVTDIEGQRLYALTALNAVATARGELRLARPEDRTTLVEWTRAFTEETGAAGGPPEAVVELKIAREQFWVWDDGGVTSMASASAPAAGATRVQSVYTPPQRRGAGYATACVEHVSRILTGRGHRCVLYTQLSNATSNAIYRRIGYEAIAEILSYDFG